MRSTARLSGLLVILAVPACAGAAAAPAPGATPPAAVEAHAHSIKPSSRVDEVAGAKVYDERGNASPCGVPQPSCPPLPASNDFLDGCRLAGFQVRQCGCEARCSGDVAAATRHYDGDGRARECATSRADCTPPQASAAFQDACTERGYRLDVCGCEWLCSGNFKK